MTDARNVLVTGPARAGTTLTCELLNTVADVVALDEPVRPVLLTGRPAPSLARRIQQRLGIRPKHPVGSASPEQACRNIEEFCAEQRVSLLERGVATSKNVDGQVTGSKVADDRGAAGLRRRLAARGEITIDKALTADFVLVVKHNSSFTALVDELAPRFPLYAIVRNPLSILRSWQTVPFPVREGHAPVGEAIDDDLRTQLAAIDDRVERQLHLLDWCFSKYHGALGPEAVVRYEDIVATGGRALQAVAPGAAQLDHTLQSRNRTSVYDAAGVRELGARLLERDGAYWNYYSRDSVTELVDAAAAETG
jgi:hypothetical protein